MKSYLYKKNQKGFTFIELVLYMGLLVFVLIILTQILTSVLGARLEAEATSSVQQDGNYILSRFYYDVTRADSIALPVNPGGQEDSMTIIIDGTPYTYSLSDGNLVLNSGGENINLNSHDTSISDLSFLRLGSLGGSNTITISFTLTSLTEREAGPEVRNYHTSAATR